MRQPISDVSLLGKSSRGIFLALMSAEVLLVWSGTIAGIEVKAFTLRVGVLLLAAVWLGRFAQGETAPARPGAVMVWAYAYAGCMAIAYLRTQRSSLNAEWFVPHLCAVSAFPLFVSGFGKSGLRRVMNLMIALAVSASAYGILQYSGYDPLTWSELSSRFRAGSFFGNKNVLGLFLIQILPLACLRFREAAGPIKAWAGASIAILVLGLILSGSRGALLCFLLVGAAFTVLYARGRGRLVPILAGAALLLCVAIPQGLRADYGKLAGDARARIHIYRIDLETLANAGWVGAGPGNFQLLHPLNRQFRYLDGMDKGAPFIILDNPHNEYLAIWLDYGLPALAAFGFLMAAMGRRIRKAARDADAALRYRLLMLSWSILNFLIYGCVTEATRYASSAFFFWVILAMLYLESGSEETPGAVAPAFLSAPAFRYLAALAGMAAIIWQADLALRTFRAKIHLRSGLATQADSPDAARAHFDAATGLDPCSVEAWYAKGYALFVTGRFPEAIASYGKADSLAPGYSDVNHNLASCFYKLENWGKTMEFGAKSTAIYPEHIASLQFLAYCSYYSRQPAKSLQYVSRILELDGKNAKMIDLKRKLEVILEQAQP